MRNKLAKGLGTIAALGWAAIASATVIANQQPATGGGVSRWSQLWQDPSGQGNDLDGDSICYEDFTLAKQTKINRLEWWGTGACELGFLIEFWKQDPGTVAYQPYGVFRGQGAQPEAWFATLAYSTYADPSGTTRYALDLDTPVMLPANNAANPRWFIAVIGLTAQAYHTWNWAQGLGGSTQTFQFVRGGHEGGGDLYRRLGEGRAMLIASEPTLSGKVQLADFIPGPAYQEATIDLIDAGNVVQSQTIVLGPDGGYSFRTSVTGTAIVVRVKVGHWLARNAAVLDLADADAALPTVTLENGDVDLDNVVTVFDYNVLSDAFDSVPDNPTWNPDADLDGDGAVTVYDYNILSANFDLAGD